MCQLSRNALEVTTLFIWDNRAIFYIINRTIHAECLDVEHDTGSDLFALLTREISWSTLKINFIFPHIHVLFSIYFFRKFVESPTKVGDLNKIMIPGRFKVFKRSMIISELFVPIERPQIIFNWGIYVSPFRKRVLKFSKYFKCSRCCVISRTRFSSYKYAVRKSRFDFFFCLNLIKFAGNESQKTGNPNSETLFLVGAFTVCATIFPFVNGRYHLELSLPASYRNKIS